MRLGEAARLPSVEALVSALEYCFARYRTCRALAAWTAARILGEEKAPRVKSVRELLDWIEERVSERVEEEAGDKAESIRRQRARAMIEAILRTLVESLAAHYGEA